MDFKAKKKELEQMKTQVENTYFKILGQIELIDEIIKEENKKEKKD
jgi:hypothetical protein